MTNLETSRLILRPLREGDADGFIKLIDNWNVAKTVARIPHPYVRSDFDTFLNIQNSKPVETRVPGFALQLKDGPSHAVGMIGLHGEDEIDPNSASLGFWIGEPFWRQGLVGEGVRCVMSHAFETLAFKTIYSGYAVSNTASARIHARNGFEAYGEATIQSIANPEPLPSMLVKLTLEKWRAS